MRRCTRSSSRRVRRRYAPRTRLDASSVQGGSATSPRSRSSRPGVPLAGDHLVESGAARRSCSSTSGDHRADRTRSAVPVHLRPVLDQGVDGLVEAGAPDLGVADLAERVREPGQLVAERVGDGPVQERSAGAQGERSRRIATRMVCTPSGSPSRTSGSRVRSSVTRVAIRCWTSSCTESLPRRGRLRTAAASPSTSASFDWRRLRRAPASVSRVPTRSSSCARALDELDLHLAPGRGRRNVLGAALAPRTGPGLPRRGRRRPRPAPARLRRRAGARYAGWSPWPRPPAACSPTSPATVVRNLVGTVWTARAERDAQLVACLGIDRGRQLQVPTVVVASGASPEGHADLRQPMVRACRSTSPRASARSAR